MSRLQSLAEAAELRQADSQQMQNVALGNPQVPLRVEIQEPEAREHPDIEQVMIICE